MSSPEVPRRIRVMVADDSAMVREVLREMMSYDDEVHIIGEAHDGKQALEMALSLGPDLLILDLAMPVMGGLQVIENLMADRPLPVLVLSSFANQGSVSAIKALAVGALEVMEKPLGITEDEPMREFREQLLDKVHSLSRIRVVARPRIQITPEQFENLNGSRMDRVLAIGSSVGGPAALGKLLSGLPKNAPMGIALVQHIPAGFLQGFVDWIGSETELIIKIAKEGDTVQPGQVLVAPEHAHMELRSDVVFLTDGPPVNYCRPAVDVLFKSVAVSYGPKAIGVVLTGMGNDGAEGIREIKSHHGVTFAESEETCVVYGMPRAAINTGKIDRVVALDNMSTEILKLLRPD